MKCAVIGSPIEHSLSPEIHRAAYEWLGLDWEYARHEVTADGVAAFLAGLDGTWRGLSVTMPCKSAIISHGIPDEVVSALGVGNTLIFDADPADPATTRVANTDVLGFRQLLMDFLPSEVELWGNGATARSCVFALASLGVSRVSVRARNLGVTQTLVRDARSWGIDVAPTDGESADDAVIVSTIPVSAAGEWAPKIHGAKLVIDVVYDPWPTPLISTAEGWDIACLTGLDLLAAQAVGQVELMTGENVPRDVFRDAAFAAMTRRGSSSSTLTQ